MAMAPSFAGDEVQPGTGNGTNSSGNGHSTEGAPARAGPATTGHHQPQKQGVGSSTGPGTANSPSKHCIEGGEASDTALSVSALRGVQVATVDSFQV
jgi:hypothetical protein